MIYYHKRTQDLYILQDQDLKSVSINVKDQYKSI